MLFDDELPHTGQRLNQSFLKTRSCWKDRSSEYFLSQVAVLCQFLREVDYMTAFKALQEQNR